MDTHRLAPPAAHHISRSPSPGPSLSFLPRIPFIPRRPLPSIIFTAISITLVFWSFSFWPLLANPPPPTPYEHPYDRCPVCPPGSLSSARRPGSSSSDTSSQTQVVEKGRLLKNLTMFDKPMHTFRENLWEDKKYVTSWGNAGFTNDFISYMITVYLGMLTERIPIIPAISKSHHVSSREDFYLGDVFDLPRMSDLINHPVLEWASVKRKDSVEEELVGCWAPWWLTGPEDYARDSNLPKDLLIDISYTRPPHWARFGDENWGVRLWPLAALGFDDGYAQGVEEFKPAPSYKNGDIVQPDKQLLCMDFLYYSGVIYEKDTFDSDHQPVWRFVAKHAHFLPKVTTLATRYLEHAFGLEKGVALPRFIAIHIRRSDFATWCKAGIAKEDCLPQLSAFAVRVREVREELRRRWAIRVGLGAELADTHLGGEAEWDIKHVLVTSDEPLEDPSNPGQENPFWTQVFAYGWVTIDHVEERTEEKYGGYYPLVVDQAIHSMAVGFVGTDQSTMSLMGFLRVRDWNHGVSKMVKWGQKESDLH